MAALLALSVAAELQQAKIYNQSQPAKAERANNPSGQLTASSRRTNRAEERDQENHYNYITDWLLVLFNGILAAFTVRLFYAAAEQSRDMKASVAAARQSAYAADVAAQAAQTTAKTQIGAERAWFLLVIDEENFEEVLESRLDPQSWPALIKAPDPLVRFHFENFGKSPAFVKEISTDIRIGPLCHLDLHIRQIFRGMRKSWSRPEAAFQMEKTNRVSGFCSNIGLRA